MAFTFSITRKIKEPTVESIVVQDELKVARMCNLTSNEKPVQEFCCYWCKLDTSCRPVHVPLRYRPKQVAKAFIGKVSSETYVIKGNVQESREATNFEVSEESFEVDGVFCTYACALSFILDNAHNTEYAQSETLLYTMFRKNNQDAPLFKPAPHWRLLKKFGGHLSPEEFHSSTQSYKYGGKVIYVHRVFMLE
jgi:hypothetical protein